MTEEHDTDFARWLTAEIERRGMSSGSLAKRIGTSRQSVSDWTRGAALPGLASALRLVDALGLEGAPKDAALRLAAGMLPGGAS